jgi:hypothetical protein
LGKAKNCAAWLSLISLKTPRIIPELYSPLILRKKGLLILKKKALFAPKKRPLRSWEKRGP